MKNNTYPFVCPKFLIGLLVTIFTSPLFVTAQTQTWTFEGGAGSANAEVGKNICVDGAGNVYVTGSFSNTNDFDLGAGSFPLSSAGGNDAFVASYGPTGAFRWAVRIGGASGDNTLQSGAVCTDGASVYITGNYNGAAVSIGGSPLPASANTDIFVAKLVASTGATSWVQGFGGASANDQGQALCMDLSGNVYLAGVYNNTMTTGCGATANTGGTTSDLFVMKMNSSGTCQWTKTGGALNSSDGGFGTGICYVPGVNEIAVATAYSANATYGSVNLTNADNVTGTNDLAILELDAGAGTFLSGVGVGSTVNVTSGDDACAITYDQVTGDVFATGAFGGNITFPGPAGTLINNGNTQDMWVARYSITNNNFVWAKAATGPSTERSYGIASDGAGTVVVSGGFSSGTLTLGSFSLTNTNSGGFDDVFIAAYSDANGAEKWQTKNSDSGSPTAGSSGRSITYQSGTGNYWVAGVYGQGCQFGSLGSMNSNGFADWFVAKLNAPPLLTATQSQVNLTCNGVCTGSATVVASGGVAPYTYSWSPSGGSGATASSLCAINYTCTITDANSTSITKTFSITQPTAITSSIVSQTNISCNGGSNGAATITASGGTGTLGYNWTPGNPPGDGTASVSGLSAQTWTCTITDANTCTRTQTVNITQPGVIVVNPVSQTNITCNGGSNGAASVSASGGTGTLTYNWTPGTPTGDGTASVTGLTTGTWTCTVTDANSCTNTATFNITQPSAISVTPVSQTNISCNGGSNGAASVSASGGTGTLTYNWTPGTPTGDGTASVTGLTIGTWTCTVTDANLCTGSATFNITQPSAITVTPVSQTNTSCNGGSNGAASVSASGGTGTLGYNWTPGNPTGDGTASVTGLTTGTWTCTVTDANSCSNSASFTITQPSAITVTPASQTNISCNGASNGAASVSASGGTGALTYNWTPGTPTGDGTASVTGLTTGTWTCTVTDANSCSNSASFTITQPSAITVTPVSQTNISCNGGSNGAASVSASGGTGTLTYNWTPGTPTGDGTASVTGLTTGTWTCTVTDANSCTGSATFNITQPSAITVTPVSQTNISCNGGSNGAASVSASGGTGTLTYNWTPGTPTGDGTASVTGLTTGTWTCTVTDANSCSNTATFNITQPSAISSSVSSQTDILCNGGNNGAATVFVSGGTPAYTYAWSPVGGTSATANGLSAGTYTCTITDANSCTQTQTVNITEPSALTATSSSTPATCGGNNGSATAVPSGGVGPYSYSWLPSGGASAIASSLVAGSYTCTVTDANACTTTTSVTVNSTGGITASITASSNVSCNGGSDGSATAAPTGGTGPYTYAWSPSGGNSATETGLPVGSYTCTITDFNGCSASASVSITQPTAITATNSQTNISCNGSSNGSASVVASGGTPAYTYAWTPSGGNAATASSLSTGTYTCTITDANGCTLTQTFSITEPSLLTETPSQTNVSCNGGNNGSAAVAVSGGTPAYTYAWAPTGGNASTASGLAQGTYTCNVTDANGCALTQTFLITEPTALSLVMSKTDASCAASDGTATATPSGGAGGYTYLWSPGGQTTQTATNLSAGTYSCTVTDANGCSINGSITVNSTGCGPTHLVQCGITLSTLNQTLNCVAVSGATNYQYKIMQGTTTIAIYTRGNYLTNVVLSNISTITYSQTYDISVRAMVNSVWGQYGPACSITTPAFPPGQVSASSCGVTLSSFTSPINCNAIVGATNYQWKFMQGATLIATYTRGTSLTDCQLANVPGTQYGQTYDVYVHALVGGVWGPYGTFCNITTPPFPTTQVSAAYCGVTLATISSGFSCDAVSGATNYQWKVENTALGYSSTLNSGSSSTTWRLSYHPGVLANTTYTVTVRAYVGGWGPFGTACTIRTGHSARFANPDADSSEVELSVFPNPTTGFVTVDGKDQSIDKVIVTDLAGRVVDEFEPVNSTFQINLSDEQNGIYFITILINDSKKVVKIIKTE